MRSIKPASDLPTLLRQSHARIYRIALALSGGRNSAEMVVAKVVGKCVGLSKSWETAEDAQRWFTRYTVLLTRTIKATSADDPLLSVTTDLDTVALLKAIRHLPTQQREAFFLHHGELMDLRHMATAMDCSSSAAANHLVAAVTSLRAVRVNGLDIFTSQLPDLLSKLVPAPAALEKDLESLITVAAFRAKKRTILRWFGRLLLLFAIILLWRWCYLHIEIN